MARDSSVTNGRGTSPNDERNGGDRGARDKSRDSSSAERILRDKEVEKLVYTLRNSDKTIDIYTDNLKCLTPGKYLNDEVVQVFMAYLINEKCEPPVLKRTHVFDSYFHKTITETFMEATEKEPHIKKARWRPLNKWFNGTDIFEKNFLVFPACREDHWFAIIVCYPYEVPDFNEGNVSPDQSSDSRNKPVPGIIVLDSLGMKQSLVTREIRLFLDFEWRARLTVVKDFFYHNLPEFKPVLPKQTNSYDCGIFMLAYLKAFLSSPEKFYKYVRRNQKSDQEQLANMVNMELSECSRESIKSTIYKKCKVEKPRVK